MSNKNKYWDKPTSPPPPLFAGDKEKKFVRQTTNQLLEQIIGQEIVYYPIDLNNTNFHTLYKEAIQKVFCSPIHVYVLVEYSGQQTETNSYGIDKKESPIVVHFHHKRLTDDVNLYVREGDYIFYNNSYYEIVDLNEPRLMFGQSNYQVEVSATCIRAREEIFNGKS